MEPPAEPTVEGQLPPAPRLGHSLREGAADFYFNSWRLVPANLIWGAAVIGLGVGASVAPSWLILAPLLAFPTAGIFRIAALIGRGEPASFWDGLAAWRAYVVPVLLLGAALAGCAALFLGNIAFGIVSGSPVGWAIATLAFWGLAATWVMAWTAWPLLLDPRRADQPARHRLRTAGLLILAFPRRMAGLALVVLAIVLVSTVAFVALLTVSVAFCALAATRYVLPAADRLEAGLGRARSRPGEPAPGRASTRP